MALAPGTRLGPYEIVSSIGAGGMGEVYKANDTRLERTVAVKVLPVHLAENPERKARFEREAKAISQLNHPHVCTLYDVGEQDGIDFLVMEYIEGDTLAKRLESGALPLDKALEYGVQIADGLDKAHRAGIVHRDLKPANAMLTKSGVKLLDFGLARLVDTDADSETSDAPTRQKNLTQEESIIGTLQYMAPEQLERKPADARTDVFAFGALLYEMITGSKAFEGESQASLISAIMKDEPRPMSVLEPLAPPLVERAVLQCLEKDPDERWQNAGDLKRQLAWLLEGGTDAAKAAPGRRERRWPVAMAMAILSMTLGAVAGISLWRLVPATPRETLHFEIAPAGPMTFPRLARAVALSPDGSRLVYAANGQLYMRRFDEREATPLPNTSDGTAPFFSPDGQSIAFFTSDELKRIPVAGGPPAKLADVTAGLDGSWGPDGTIVFGIRGPTRIWRVPASGGTPEPLTTREQDSTDHDYPSFLPGGAGVLFSIQTGAWDDAQTAVYSLETGEVRIVLEGGFCARYVPTGHLVFVRGGGLLAIPFDLATLTATGDPRPVVERVLQGSAGGQFDLSSDGKLAYVSGSILSAESTLVWVDRDGEEEPLPTPPEQYLEPRVSSDGRRIAVDILDFENQDVWVADALRGTLTKVTTHPAQDFGPLWTPDNERVVFRSNRAGAASGFFSKAADGTGDAKELFVEDERDVAAADSYLVASSWSSDGKSLVFGFRGPGSTRDIGLLSMADGAWQPLIQTEANEDAPAVSPDGKWIAYASDVTGQSEIYVERFPELGQRQRISRAGGSRPVWSPDGRELFYLSDVAMMVVPVETEPSFTLGATETLFDTRTYRSRYDVAPDGQRFLMVKREEVGMTSDQINIVLNWTDELERRVPVDN